MPLPVRGGVETKGHDDGRTLHPGRRTATGMMLDLPAPDPAIELVVASRGISKGLAQTDGPQILVRPELGFGDVYVGGYAKNVTSATLDGEAGPVVGLRTRLAGFELAASATVKLAVAPVGDGDNAAFELAGSASRRFGAFGARLGVTWSPDDLGSTERSWYVEGGASYALGRSTTISANLARRERSGGPDYTAFNFGIARALSHNVSVELRWYDTDRDALGDAFDERLVGAVRLRF